MIQLLDLCAQLPQTRRLVLVLAARLARGDNLTGRQVCEPDSALGLVDVLAAGATRTEGVNLAFTQKVFVGFRQYDHLYLRVWIAISTIIIPYRDLMTALSKSDITLNLMKQLAIRIFTACLFLTLGSGWWQTTACGQTRERQARKFDEFTNGIGSPEWRQWWNQKEQEKGLKARFTRYARELRKEGARPYAITYSPRIVEWEIYNRSIAEMRAGSLWEHLTPQGFDWKHMNWVNGGFREVAATELWIVPPGAQPPCPTPTVKPEDVAYCPFVRIIGAPYIARLSGPIKLSARLEVNDKKIQPTFTWEVSQGKIISGQGTDTIAVELADNASGALVAKVSVNGYSFECPLSATTAAATTTFRVSHFKFDEFGDINCEDELARLDNLAITLMNDPTLQVHVVFYGGRTGPRNEALARAARIKSYLMLTRGIEAGRVIPIDGGYRNELSGELWLSLRGTGAPVPRPTIDRRYVTLTGRVEIGNSPCSYE